MAEQTIQVTGGSGNQIDVFLVGTSNLRQVVVLGDPAIQGAVAPIGATQGLKIWLGADGISVGNFPTGFNVNNSPTIANTGFGSSVTNFPTGFNVNNSPTIANAGFGVSNRVNIVPSTDLIQNGTSQLGITFTSFDVGAAGDNTIISGASGMKIKVLKLSFTSGVSNIILWKSGASSTLLSGKMTIGSPGGMVEPQAEFGIFQTGVSLPLILNLNSGGSVGGYMTFTTI